jgi:putative membrane protein
MRNRHHHQYHALKEWHAGQREKRKREKWVPYSLRWKGGGFVKVVPQVRFPSIFILARDRHFPIPLSTSHRSTN